MRNKIQDALCFFVPPYLGPYREIYQFVTTKVVPNVIPNRYLISNYGVLYDTVLMRYYPTETCNSNWYIGHYFKLIDGTIRRMPIHVVVLRTFGYKDGCEKLFVNHIDGVKFHNWLWNLEWTTCQENNAHAVRTGLTPIGEDKTGAKATNAEINMVCDLIARGYRTIDIVNIMEPYLPNSDIVNLVNGIKRGRKWKHISKNYDFSNMNRRQGFLISDSQVHKICQIMQTYGKNTYSCRELLEMIGFEYSNYNKKDRKLLKDEISMLRGRHAKKGICDLYNY